MTLCPPSVAFETSLSVGQGQLGLVFACTPPWASDPPPALTLLGGHSPGHPPCVRPLGSNRKQRPAAHK